MIIPDIIESQSLLRDDTKGCMHVHPLWYDYPCMHIDISRLRSILNSLYVVYN